MANNGLHKIIGSQFTRVQPALCGYCVHYRPLAQDVWDVCSAKGKLLSNPHALEGKCSQFERAPEPTASIEVIAEWRETAQDHQNRRKR